MGRTFGLSPTEKATLCRAVAVGNIPPGGLKPLRALAAAAGEVLQVTDPIPERVAAFAKLAQDGCSGHSVLLHFSTGKEAFEAVAKLHRQAVGKGAGGGAVLWARQVNGEGASVRRPAVP